MIVFLPKYQTDCTRRHLTKQTKCKILKEAVKMNFEGIKDFYNKFLKPLLHPFAKPYNDRKRIEKDLGNIIFRIQGILDDTSKNGYDKDEYAEIEKRLTNLLEHLNRNSIGDEEKELKLHSDDTKNKNIRKELQSNLKSAKSFFQERRNNDDLRVLSESLRHVSKDINPLPNFIKKDRNIRLHHKILLGVPVAIAGAITLFNVIDQSQLASMKKECKSPPGYRSNKWLAQMPVYGSMAKESYLTIGNTCIDLFFESKNKNYISIAKTAFANLKSIDEKNIPAVFFLEYIPNIIGSKTSEYKESIELIKNYEKDINGKNFPLLKEDFDIVVKIAHILEGKHQNYKMANKLYELILRQEGNQNHLNSLLGICTTHFKWEKKNDRTNTILAQCKKSVEILTNQESEKDDEKLAREAIAHYNYGCMLLRMSDYPEAEKQFSSAEGNYPSNQSIQKAVSFSRLINGKYEKVNSLVSNVLNNVDTDMPNSMKREDKEFYRDMQMGLGLSFLAKAEAAEDKDKKEYYDKAYKNIENSLDKEVMKLYLEKISNCKNKKQQECLATWPPKNIKDKNSLYNHIHSKFGSFINHYQVKPSIAKGNVMNDPEEKEKRKKYSCTILREADE